MFDEVGGHCLDCVHIALIQSWLLLGGLGESMSIHPTLQVDEWVGDKISGAHYVEVTFHQPL